MAVDSLVVKDHDVLEMTSSVLQILVGFLSKNDFLIDALNNLGKLNLDTKDFMLD